MAILHMNFRSDFISRSVYPTVFLPDMNMRRDAEPPYATLYFLHGYSGGGLETAMFSNIALYAMKHGIAVVLPDGENSFYTDDEQRGALFSRYVGEELPEVTRNVLQLSRDRGKTYIGGISMGGYGALINGLRFSGTFGKIAMLSPALGFKREDDEAEPGSPTPRGELLATMGRWEEYRGSYRDYETMAARAAERPESMPELFLTYGTEDQLIMKGVRRFEETMEKTGKKMTIRRAPGGHDHTFWKQAMDPMFRFLKGEEDEPGCI